MNDWCHCACYRCGQEDDALYVARVKAGAASLRRRFVDWDASGFPTNPRSGNVAVYTHATTTFSIAYGV
jgi:hypothetical protein